MNISIGKADVPDMSPIGNAASAEPNPHVVILVHGTGSASMSDNGDQWWQRGSDFSRNLDQHLQPFAQCLASDDLFHWSGNNSEKDRRLFGRQLFDEYLRPFEDQGRPYHLVGHSHGGSVIMSALVESARLNYRLDHLRSWSTIGTPFLNFKASAWNKSGLLPILTAIIAIAWLFPVTSEYLSHRADLVQDKDISALILPPLLLAVPLLVTGILILIWVISLVRRGESAKSAILHQKVVLDYGDRWLGIASNADEAINGLGSTLTLRSRVAWRIPEINGDKRWLKMVLWPLRLLIRFYNNLIAGPADEFVWSQVTRRLQGSDIRGYVLASVSRGLWFGALDVIPLDPAVEADILTQANTYAGRTLASVRNLLGLASQSSDSGHNLLAGFQNSMTWNELVHTSYMMFPAVRERVVGHILSRIKHEPPAVERSGPKGDLSIPKQSAITSLARLGFVSNLAAAVIIALMAALAALVGKSLVGPYTNEYQIQAIWKQLSDPELRNPHGASLGLASVLAAHTMLLRDGGDDAFALAIVSPHTRHLAIQRVAEAHALANEVTDAQRLIQKIDDQVSFGGAEVALYDQLASNGSCSAAETIRSAAVEAAHNSQDIHLLLLAAHALKKCKLRDQALKLVSEARAIAPAKPWDANDLSSRVASLDEEAETLSTIADFSKPTEVAHQAISAAAVFMKQGNANAARTLLSRIDRSQIPPADSFDAMKLFAQLGDISAVDTIISESGLLSCSALAELGDILAKAGRKKDVLDVEQLLVAAAQVLPVPANVAECLFDVSLLQELTADSTRARTVFDKAAELMTKVHDDSDTRASLSTLAAEVKLRSGRNSEVTGWLRTARLEASRLDPTPAFNTLMRLARIALAAGAVDELRAVLKNAQEAVGLDTEYQSRSPKYRTLSGIYSEAGWYRKARLVAERSAIADDRLQAYGVIIWHIRGHDAPLLRSLLRVVQGDDGAETLTELDSYEQKRAEVDERGQELRLAFGPVCPKACSAAK